MEQHESFSSIFDDDLDFNSLEDLCNQTTATNEAKQATIEKELIFSEEEEEDLIIENCDPENSVARRLFNHVRLLTPCVCTIEEIQKVGQSGTTRKRVPLLCAVVKKFTYNAFSSEMVLEDFTGSSGASVHNEIIKNFPLIQKPGSIVLIKNVVANISVSMKTYLTVSVQNVLLVVSEKDYGDETNYDSVRDLVARKIQEIKESIELRSSLDPQNENLTCNVASSFMKSLVYVTKRSSQDYETMPKRSKLNNISNAPVRCPEAIATLHRNTSEPQRSLFSRVDSSTSQSSNRPSTPELFSSSHASNQSLSSATKQFNFKKVVTPEPPRAEGSSKGNLLAMLDGLEEEMFSDF